MIGRTAVCAARAHPGIARYLSALACVATIDRGREGTAAPLRCTDLHCKNSGDHRGCNAGKAARYVAHEGLRFALLTTPKSTWVICTLRRDPVAAAMDAWMHGCSLVGERQSAYHIYVLGVVGAGGRVAALSVFTSTF